MLIRKLTMYVLVALAALCTTGCPEKDTRSVTLEGPESEVTFEMETTDKTPDDEDE